MTSSNRRRAAASSARAASRAAQVARLLPAIHRVVDLLRLEDVGPVALHAATDQVEAHCRELDLEQLGKRFVWTAQLCRATSHRGVWIEFAGVADELLEAVRHAAGTPMK